MLRVSRDQPSFSCPTTNVMTATATPTSTKADRDDHAQVRAAAAVPHLATVPVTVPISALSPTPIASPNSFSPDSTAVGSTTVAPPSVTRRKVKDFHHTHPPHKYQQHAISIPSAAANNKCNNASFGPSSVSINPDHPHQLYQPSFHFTTSTCSPITSTTNSKKLKAAARASAAATSTSLLCVRIVLLLIAGALFLRGQVYIASTFAGTRPYRGVPPRVPVFTDTSTEWKGCLTIFAASLRDIGDAGRIWLRHAYVGSNRPVDINDAAAVNRASFSNASSTTGGIQNPGDRRLTESQASQADNSFRQSNVIKSEYKSTLRPSGDDGDQYRCRCLKPELYVNEIPRVTAIVQSYNHHDNVSNITKSLKRANAVDEIIVNEDGSTDGSLYEWKSALLDNNDFIIRSNNLHELRSYNRALRIASGDIIVLLRSNDRLPVTDEWIRNAQQLFAALPDLGVLGGYIGQTWNYDSGIGDEFGNRNSTHGGVGDGDTKALPFIEPKTKMPFMYSECTWSSPLFIRKDVVNEVGGLDLTIARQGEQGVWQDCMFSYEAWMKGFTVGTFHVPFDRELGRRGPRSSAMNIKLRNRVYGRAVGYANRKFPRRRIHDAVQSLNQQTLWSREEQADQQEDEESRKLSGELPE